VARIRETIVHFLRHLSVLAPGAPRGIINDVRGWVEERTRSVPADIRRGPPAAYWPLDAPLLRSLPPPLTLEGARHDRGVPRLVPIPETGVVFLKGARILGAEGTVISPDNRVFAEFTYVDEPGGVGTHSVFRRLRFPKSRSLPGWYATITYPSSFAYYHWIVETLPRLRLIEPWLEALDGVFVPGRLEPAQRESLEVFGVKKEKMIPMEMMDHYEPEHLLVPLYCAGLNIPEWVPQYLREKVHGGGEKAAPTRRLYVSRADASCRRVKNEAEIEGILKERGFETIRARDHSFLEQTRRFAEAEVVVGAHGAGLANVVWCQPGAKLLELLPSPDAPPHVYHSLMTAGGGEYWYLFGTPWPEDGDRDRNRDFIVNGPLLNENLTLLCKGGGKPPERLLDATFA
jgi:capsular polysaccharide biosynthesis protein